MDDETVIKVMMTKLEELEKAGKSYIVEGFPRTRLQAMALQDKGIVPDKFFVLNLSESNMHKALVEKLKATEQVASRMVLQYSVYIFA